MNTLTLVPTLELRFEELEPFGLLVRAPESASLWALDPDTVKAWVATHRVVVLRGFAPLAKTELPGWCRQLGQPLAWDFGTINELRARPDAVNYLFTPAAVPLHWDGAFSGEIPHYIFFQCLQAPAPGTGGETTFVDTPRVLQRLPEAERAQLEKLSITYSTEKIVHYGGSFTQALIDTDPASGAKVLRYAEPVTDINPVSLQVSGLDATAQADLIAELADRLYDPAVCLEHHWQDGDYLIADNFTLLHGRRAYAEPAARHLRRVNILPPAQPGWKAKLIAQLRLRRPEFLVAEIPILLMPLLLMAGSPAILANATIWEGLLALYLLFNIGDLINCLADRDLDAVYKPKLSQAVYAIGVKNLVRDILLWSAIGFGLTLHVAWQLDRWTLAPLWLLGLGLAAQYSLPPWRMKSAGFWHFAGWWGILFAGPMLFCTLLAAPLPRWEAGVFVLSFGLMQCTILLVNSAEDYPEDLETGMRTVIVATGLVPGMVWAARLILLTGLLHLGLLLWLSQGHAPWLHLLTVAGTGFWLWVCHQLWELKGRVQAEPDKALEHIRVSARLVPLYMTVIALGNLAWVLAWSLNAS
ncbi:MAG TPA: TauD/TfdA family dioxygenase [Candidatus Obscuribacterales bacterium]